MNATWKIHLQVKNLQIGSKILGNLIVKQVTRDCLKDLDVI